MALELQDTEVFDGNIPSTESETLEVETATADYIQVMLDGGTTGTTPAQYTVTQEYYQPDIDDYMEYSEATGQTSQTIRDTARGARLRFSFTNTSGASSDYRIVVETFKEI